MRFGLFSNDRRPDRTLGESWDLDIAEIVAADAAGFDEAWVSEHQSPAELVIAKAAAQTSRIRLGPAVRPLAYYHPLQVAIEANAVDHLTGGRYMFGAGFGFYAKHFEARGIDFAQVRAMMHASLDLVIRLWTAREPIDYDGPFWTGRQMWVEPKSVQTPHPPVAVAANNTDGTVRLAGGRGFRLLTGDFISPARLKHFGAVFDEAAGQAGRGPSRGNFTVCRVIYVAETDAEARRDMRASYDKTIRWEIAHTPHHQVERIPQGGSFDDITFDYLVDTGNLVVGSPETVHRRLLDLYGEIGGFGQVNFHAGRDYATPEKVARSMRLFMAEVAPRLRELDPDRQAAA